MLKASFERMPKKGKNSRLFYRLFALPVSLFFSKFLICLWTSSKKKNIQYSKKKRRNRKGNQSTIGHLPTRPPPSFVCLARFFSLLYCAELTEAFLASENRWKVEGS